MALGDALECYYSTPLGQLFLLLQKVVTSLWVGLLQSKGVWRAIGRIDGQALQNVLFEAQNICLLETCSESNYADARFTMGLGAVTGPPLALHQHN